MEAPDLDAALTAMRQVRSRAHTASDEELLLDGAVVEELGRLVDAHRLAFAGQVEQRTVHPTGLPLAFREGARDGIDLVAHVARIDRSTAKRRIGLGAALAPTVSVFGEALPGRFAPLADAVTAGAVGVDSARVIVPTRWRGDPKPEHRRQPGPLADPDLSRLRWKRDADPWDIWSVTGASRNPTPSACRRSPRSPPRSVP